MACDDYKGFTVMEYMVLLFNLLFNQLLDFMNGSWGFSVYFQFQLKHFNLTDDKSKHVI